MLTASKVTLSCSTLPLLQLQQSTSAFMHARITMNWLMFVAGAVLSWGVYGAMLHQGQVKLGSPMRALLCVGVAYFLVGVVVPVVTLFAQGQGLRGFTSGARRRRRSPARSGRSARCASSSRSAPAAPRPTSCRWSSAARRSSTSSTRCDTHPPKTRPKPDAVPRVPGHRHRRWNGAVLQASGLTSNVLGATCRCCQLARGMSHRAVARSTLHPARVRTPNTPAFPRP